MQLYLTKFGDNQTIVRITKEFNPDSDPQIRIRWNLNKTAFIISLIAQGVEEDIKTWIIPLDTDEEKLFELLHEAVEWAKPILTNYRDSKLHN